jgi:hypothetical protein
MRNAQPAQGLSATSFDFSSGRNGGRYGALCERLLPCRRRSQTRMPTFDLAVELDRKAGHIGKAHRSTQRKVGYSGSPANELSILSSPWKKPLFDQAKSEI